MPVNLRVVQLSASGETRVITDNTGRIGNMLAAGAHRSGGCAFTPGTDPLDLGATATLALAAALLLTRRKLRGRR